MSSTPDYFFLDGQKLVATDNGDGTKTLVVSSTGGGGSGAAGTPVLDNAGVRWLWVYDASAGTSTYISFATGSAGTPTFPVTPDADTSVQVSNFPATQPVSGPLTDAQLRATAVPVSAVALPLPTGAATSALQTAGNTSLSNLDTDVGAQADAAATTDTGSFSIIAFIKRGLQNWTTLLARVPTLVSGRVPVDASGLTLTVIPINPNGGSFITTASEETLTALNNKVPAQSTPGLLPVDTLGTPGVPRVQATGAAAASIALTTTCRRLSMYATQGTWYSISGTATSSSHYIAAGERLDIDVPASTTISVLQETSAGSIRISELT